LLGEEPAVGFPGRDWAQLDAAALPDGDANLGQMDFSAFAVPALCILRQSDTAISVP
jgi:hypothetical protein